MTLHLIKLCVGADSIDDLRQWQAERLAERRRRGEEPVLKHTTRQMPKRRPELIDGGSLYWVIRGEVLVRQAILDLRPSHGEDGIERCDICLEPELVRVEPRPRGPFQGWRYLAGREAPADLGAGPAGALDMPDGLRRELYALGLV
jgi:hypothetical protein